MRENRAEQAQAIVFDTRMDGRVAEPVTHAYRASGILACEEILELINKKRNEICKVNPERQIHSQFREAEQ